MDTQPAPAVTTELTATLERERDRITASLRSLVAAEQALSASQAEEGAALGAPADVASDLADAELDSGLAEAASDRLAAIEAALRRVADGSYGICRGCRRAIDVERLRALPWATECIQCASRRPGVSRPAGSAGQFEGR